MNTGLEDEIRDTTIPLHKILEKHQTNLKKVITTKNKEVHEKKSKKKTKTNIVNITCSRGVYMIRKYINSKSVYYGSYDTLEGAKRVKQELIKHNWDIKCLDKICKELGVRRRNRETIVIKYTLWDASKVRYFKNKKSLRRFRVAYDGHIVPMAYFLDFLTCEIINNLIREFV